MKMQIGSKNNGRTIPKDPVTKKGTTIVIPFFNYDKQTNHHTRRSLPSLFVQYLHVVHFQYAYNIKF